MTILPALIQRFFTERLCAQMEASPHTIAGYRDTFRLLLRYASERTGRVPTRLKVEDLDCDLVGEFLTHVETERGNTARSRNTRLAAIRSFFRFVAISEPDYLLQCQRILAMPGKRYARRTVEFLDRTEMDALLTAPDRATWVGRRDHAILMVALQTGLRVSEITGLRRRDVLTGTGAHLRCEGKGRKERCTPLRRETVKVLEVWLKERQGGDSDPLFPTSRGYSVEPRRSRRDRAAAYAGRVAVLPVARRQASKPSRTSAQYSDGPAAPRRRPDGNRALARA